MDKNTIEILASVVEEPELRYTPQGLAILRLRLGGEIEGERNTPFYLRTVLFGRMAEAFVDSLYPQKPVYVEGRLSQRSWKDEQGYHEAINVIASSIAPMELNNPHYNQDRLLGATNHAVIAGRLANDALARTTQQGDPYLIGRVATNDRFRNNQGEWESRAQFFNFILWGELDQVPTKGTPVLISGPVLFRKDRWRIHANEFYIQSRRNKPASPSASLEEPENIPY